MSCSLVLFNQNALEISYVFPYVMLYLDNLIKDFASISDCNILDYKGVDIMTNAELLVAISDVLEQKLEEKLEEKLDKKLEEKLDKKLEEKLDVKFKQIDNRFDKLEQDVRKIRIICENDLQPRLQNIESCYLSTYRRYQESVAEHDTMKLDIQVLKSVVKEHSEKLQKIS